MMIGIGIPSSQSKIGMFISLLKVSRRASAASSTRRRTRQTGEGTFLIHRMIELHLDPSR